MTGELDPRCLTPDASLNRVRIVDLPGVALPPEVALLHDGTAAALACAGEERAAVITMGTALGVGFSPSADGLRPIAPGFSIT